MSPGVFLAPTFVLTGKLGRAEKAPTGVCGLCPCPGAAVGWLCPHSHGTGWFSSIFCGPGGSSVLLGFLSSWQTALPIRRDPVTYCSTLSPSTQILVCTGIQEIRKCSWMCSTRQSTFRHPSAFPAAVLLYKSPPVPHSEEVTGG